MRLIDADALLVEAMAEGAYGYVDAKQIADAQTIDATPVVRCRDCKHWKPKGKEKPASIPALGYCKQRFKCETACWEFCFFGERKENEAD